MPGPLLGPVLGSLLGAVLRREVPRHLRRVRRQRVLHRQAGEGGGLVAVGVLGYLGKSPFTWVSTGFA